MSGCTHAGAAGQSTYFLDGRNVATLPPVKWGRTSLRAKVSEAVRVGKKHVGMRLLENGAVVQTSRPGGGVAAFTTGIPKPGSFGDVPNSGSRLRGRQAALHLMTYDPNGQSHTAFLFPFAAAGAAVGKALPAPMLSDTSGVPRRCNAVVRKDTTRLVVPYQGGTRHPIVVTDATEPMRVMLTARAVMHGSVESPCVAAFDAEGIPLDPTDSDARFDRAIVLLDDSEPSWLFRRNTTTSPTSYEGRTMTCRFDPNADVPLEVYSAPGTMVGRAY